MKKLKALLFLGLAGLLTPFAGGADNVSYTATSSPGDAIDGNDAVDVWAVDGVGGSSRSYLKGAQDGNENMWAIWDLDGEGGTYATHTFAGGPLYPGQTVSLDWCHRVDIDIAIGIRLMEGDNIEAEFKFIGGELYFSKYDTSSGQYVLTDKRYDNYDIFRVSFTLTGPNEYVMSATTGTIADNGFNGTEDGNPDPGEIADQWTGSFTGSSIDSIVVYTEGGNESDIWYDNLSINEDWLMKASGELPIDDDEEVPVADLEMSWTIAREYDNGQFIIDPNLASYNVYYNEEEPNFIDITPSVVDSWDNTTMRASFTPSPELGKNNTCYWRVDTVLNDATVITGDIWQFSTELTRVKILAGPEMQIVDPGATAEFSIDIESETPATYQWYKYVDGENDTMLVDGGDISGSTTSTLTIANSAAEDDGAYYCIANNTSGIAVESVTAMMAVKRKLAYWTFEYNSTDNMVADSPATIVEGSPTFEANGIDGGAITFADNSDMLYTDPEAAGYFDSCDYGMTVSCWVKSTNNKSWVPLVCRNGEANGWQLRQNGYTANRPCFTTRGTGNDDGTSANRTIYDGQWHYIVGTFDGSSKKVYIDGTLSVKYSTDTGELTFDGDNVSTPIRASLSPVAIAGRVSGSGEELNVELNNNCPGTYDNVTIYNYALSAAEVAQNYADISGNSVCGSTLEYDLNGDCTVNLNDLGMMAGQWLSSTLVEPAAN